jgi:lysozyme
MNAALQLAVPVVKRWEGFSAKPYICPAGHWTIGYGTLCAKDHPPVTREQAEAMMLRDLVKFQRSVQTLCPVVVTEPPSREAALISFTYNLGAERLRASTLRRKVNAREWPEAGRQMRRWVWGGGVKLPGLIARREQEARMLE